MVSWMCIDVECAKCHARRQIVLGTKNREEKPIAKCPECKSEEIKILSVNPKSAEKV